MDAPITPITLWCFVWGEGAGCHDSFPITITEPSKVLVGQLKALVLEQKANTLTGLDADSLTLWKV